MRIGYDATAMLGPRTGIGVFVTELGRRLALRPDTTLRAFALTWRGRGELDERTLPGAHIVRRPMAARPLRTAWLRADHPTIERWTGRIDVVHGPNYVVPPARRAAEVVSVHDLTVLHHPELCTADTLAYPDLVRRAVRRGAWVHTDTDSIGVEVTEAFAVPPERVVTVPLAPSVVPPAEGADGRHLAAAERYVLALGTVEPRKDLPGLVAAFDAVAASAPDVNLVVAGPDGWGSEALDLALERSQHRQQIVRLGWVNEAERAALLRGATVLAYPSLYEGFGLPPLEAMSVGVPVVATSVGALVETCGDAALLVPPKDTDALAEALTSVLERPDTAAELVRRGQENLRRFDWDRTTAEMLELYRRAVG
ncbi:MAG: glycosyltransferase family 4 protein [Acidimicrobiia bacterium]|nr:glycosyltransferase family 4 protein [Acidimicrobiia bacterium]